MRTLWEVLLFLVRVQKYGRRPSWHLATGKSQGISVAEKNRQPHVLRYRRTHIHGVLWMQESLMPQMHQHLRDMRCAFLSRLLQPLPYLPGP